MSIKVTGKISNATRSEINLLSMVYAINCYDKYGPVDTITMQRNKSTLN